MNGPIHDIVIPPELRDLLGKITIGCTAVTTEEGFALAIRAPREMIEGLRGRIQVEIGFALYSAPTGPVVRIEIAFYDRPEPMVFESFANVAEPGQKADLLRLAEQDHIKALFFDDTITCVLAKKVTLHGVE
jgi:hypothetical protein